MRRVLPLIAIVLLGFAPVPFPKAKPRPAKPVVVALALIVLDASVVAGQLQSKLGTGSGVGITFNAATNTLFLKGQQGNIDRIVMFVRERDEVPW